MRSRTILGFAAVLVAAGMIGAGVTAQDAPTAMGDETRVGLPADMRGMTLDQVMTRCQALLMPRAGETAGTNATTAANATAPMRDDRMRSFCQGVLVGHCATMMHDARRSGGHERLKRMTVGEVLDACERLMREHGTRAREPAAQGVQAQQAPQQWQQQPPQRMGASPYGGAYGSGWGTSSYPYAGGYTTWDTRMGGYGTGYGGAYGAWGY